MIKSNSNKKESGSIMLEVVAVLALMGVMGAMLFRQIYQRNQELHNIQMASEIRTIKEAFSAYIGANRASILSSCPVPKEDEVKKCNIDMYEAVHDYLPDGWFTSDELKNAYTLTLWNYNQDLSSGRRVVYGIVVPTIDTLPSSGWNFKRAARVALLIGADGGAYDPTITDGDIAGALGSWQINPANTGVDLDKPTYVAMTGIDIFAPEYEAGEGSVNLPAEWSLALKDLHAYNYFSVGNSGSSDCYTLQHQQFKTEGDASSGVKSDVITKNLSGACKPLFWVGNESGGNAPKNGNVYVATDLNIGQIGTDSKYDSALKLTAEGVIKQKDGLTIDKDGRIISKETVSANIGELVSGEHFVVDPAYTSTMNDIRLASRGGVRLSDILPNYILKNQYSLYRSITGKGANSNKKGTTDGNTTTTTVSWVDLYIDGDKNKGSVIPFPDCPTGYNRAFVAIPTHFGGYKPQVAKNNTTDVITFKTTTNVSTNTSGISIPSSTSLNATINKQFVTDVDVCQSFVELYEFDNSKKLSIAMGYREPKSANIGGTVYSYVCENLPNVSSGEILHATVQTYCVWSPSLYDGQETKCKAAGYDYNSGKCTNYRRMGLLAEGLSVTGAERDQYLCKAAGFTWISATSDVAGHCQYKYISADDINHLTKVTSNTELGSVFNETDTDLLKRKAAVCKAAGYKWTGTKCEK